MNINVYIECICMFSELTSEIPFYAYDHVLADVPGCRFLYTMFSI